MHVSLAADRHRIWCKATTFASSSCHPTRFPNVRPQSQLKGHTCGRYCSGCTNKCACGCRTTSMQNGGGQKRQREVGASLDYVQTSKQKHTQSIHSWDRPHILNICTRRV
ncbi:unnamed protein product [Ectocarpus sp. 12 AP-2014]